MEQVLVVPREVLFGDVTPHGFIPLGAAPEGGRVWLSAIRERGSFAPRSGVEDDPSKKQIIPYAVLLRGQDMLLLHRLAGGGERRLHHLYSVGVGGHINRVDENRHDDVLLAGARRELMEEVTLTGGRMGVVGFVNDETNAVGSVHFGVVLRVDVWGGTPVSREPDELAAELHPIREVLARYAATPAAFETWSCLVLSGLDRVVEAVPPSVVTVP